MLNFFYVSVRQKTDLIQNLKKKKKEKKSSPVNRLLASPPSHHLLLRRITGQPYSDYNVLFVCDVRPQEKKKRYFPAKRPP